MATERTGWGSDSRPPVYAEDLERLVVGAGIGVSPSFRRTVAGRIDAAVATIVNLVLGRPR